MESKDYGSWTALLQEQLDENEKLRGKITEKDKEIKKLGKQIEK